MGSFTLCNFCNLRAIRQRAKEEGKSVVLEPKDEGTTVLVDGVLAAWMQHIPSQCECD